MRRGSARSCEIRLFQATHDESLIVLHGAIRALLLAPGDEVTDTLRAVFADCILRPSSIAAACCELVDELIDKRRVERQRSRFHRLLDKCILKITWFEAMNARRNGCSIGELNTRSRFNANLIRACFDRSRSRELSEAGCLVAAALSVRLIHYRSRDRVKSCTPALFRRGVCIARNLAEHVVASRSCSDLTVARQS